MNEIRARKITQILQDNGWSVVAVADKNWDGSPLWGVKFLATDVVYYTTSSMPQSWQDQVQSTRERS